MKNIFKFMGLALVAGSLLFTACKKDEPETNDTTTPATPQENVYKITFDGNVVSGLNYVDAITNGQIYMFQAAGGVSGDEFIEPVFQLSLGNLQGTLYLTDQLQYQDGTAVSDDYPTYAIGENGADYELLGINAEPVYSKFDATKYIISCVIDLAMFNYDDALAAIDALAAELGLTQEDIEAMSEADYQAFVQRAAANVTDRPALKFELENYTFRNASAQ